MTGQKGALHQNTFCLGSLLARLCPLPQQRCQHFPLQFLLSPSLISSLPPPASILSNRGCLTLRAREMQAVCSPLIGPRPPHRSSTSGKVNGCSWPGMMMSASVGQKTHLSLNHTAKDQQTLRPGSFCGILTLSESKCDHTATVPRDSVYENSQTGVFLIEVNFWGERKWGIESNKEMKAAFKSTSELNSQPKCVNLNSYNQI